MKLIAENYRKEILNLRKFIIDNRLDVIEPNCLIVFSQEDMEAKDNEWLDNSTEKDYKELMKAVVEAIELKKITKDVKLIKLKNYDIPGELITLSI